MVKFKTQPVTEADRKAVDKLLRELRHAKFDHNAGRAKQIRRQLRQHGRRFH